LSRACCRPNLFNSEPKEKRSTRKKRKKGQRGSNGNIDASELRKELNKLGLQQALDNPDFINIKDFVAELIEDNNLDLAVAYTRPYILIP